MFRLFKKSIKEVVTSVIEPAPDFTIEEIHNAFDTAHVDLVDEANRILAREMPDSDNAKLIKASRLEALGFNNSKPVASMAIVKDKLAKDKEEKLKAQELAATVNYYQSSYPFLKFLTESKLDVICKKYNLIYAPVEFYKEDVPEKNISEIEKSQNLRYSDKPSDRQVVIIHDFWPSVPSEIRRIFKNPIECNFPYGRPNDSQCLKLAKELGYSGDYDGYIYGSNGATLRTFTRSGLFIAAPKNHFDLSKLKSNGIGYFDVKDIWIPDPIVFRYVRGGIQVLSKWGLEASDPDLLNPINN